MKPELRIEGASLVLFDAYTATVAVMVGDALKITGEWKVAPTQATDDESIGTAWNSANIGQPVAVVIGGLARILTMDAVQRGDVIVPSQDNRGKGRRADKVSDLLSGKARRYGVATETKDAGKPVWIHSRGS